LILPYFKIKIAFDPPTCSADLGEGIPRNK